MFSIIIDIRHLYVYRKKCGIYKCNNMNSYNSSKKIYMIYIDIHWKQYLVVCLIEFCFTRDQIPCNPRLSL